MRRLVLLMAAAAALRADDRTQKLLDRLAQEAEAFETVAPQVMGIEMLHQRALVPPPRFKLRVGKDADDPPAPAWRERDIISQYGFTVFGSGSIQELRQVMIVDRRRIANDGRAQAELAALVTGNDEARKRKALLQMERYGLRGGATDFGQILLLFSRSSAERYEITYAGPGMLGSVPVQKFRYRQIDGPEALALFRKDKTDPLRRLRGEGEIWVREPDGSPARITFTATDTSSEKTVREEASVDYTMSEFGVLLPAETDHRETQAGDLVAENKFVYAGFHRFGTAR